MRRLKGGESGWSSIIKFEESNKVATERRKACVMSVVMEENLRMSNVTDVEKRFTSLGELLNVTACVRRFIFTL